MSNRRSSGRIAAPGHPLIDLYLVAGDLGRKAPPPTAIQRLLAPVPVERALLWVARMLAPFALGGNERRRLERKLAIDWFTQSAGEIKARDLVLSGQRRLLVPHILLYLARLALLHCSTKPASDSDNPRDIKRYNRLMIDAMLLTAHHAGMRRLPGAALTDGHPAVTVMDLEMSASMLASHVPFVASTFDRSERRWIEIPNEDNDPQAVNLAAEFEAATGVRLSDLRMAGLVLWARVAAGGDPHVAYDHFDQIPVNPQRIRAALSLISGTLDELRDDAHATSPNAEYDSDLFARRPLVVCNDGSYLILNPLLLIERTIGWLPRWDLANLAATGPQGKARADRAVSYLRRSTELHAIETLAAVATASTPPAEFYAQDSIQAAYGTKQKNADCALIWPGHVIVAEISSRTVVRGTATGTSTASFEKDLNLGILEKARQLAGTIAAIRADSARLANDLTPDQARRFRPLLVTTEGFPWTPTMTARVQNMLSDAGLLQDDDTDPLVLVDIDALEATESITERTSRPLYQLLADHADSPLWSFAYRDWLLVTFQPVRPTQRIMDRWDRVLEPILAMTPEDFATGI